MQTPPENEYFSQLLREGEAAKISNLAKTTLNSDTASTPNLDNSPSPRAPYAASISDDLNKTSKPKTRKNKRLAQPGNGTFTQLTLWD